MIKRKFRLRIYRRREEYFLQWAYFYFFPTWKFIPAPFVPGMIWDPNLRNEQGKLTRFFQAEIEEMASSFNTIEKVKAFVEQQQIAYREHNATIAATISLLKQYDKGRPIKNLI